MQKMLWTSLLVVVFGTAIPTGELHAQTDDGEENTTEQVEALSAEGAELFGNEEYEAAIEKFEEAYALQPVPNLLYNIGRCYEQLEDWEEARHYFEQYTRSPDVDSDARRHAMERIDNLRELQRAEQEESDDEPDPDEVIAETPEELRGGNREPNLVPGFVASGTGVGLLGAAVLTGVFAQGNARQIDNTELAYEDRLEAQSSARIQGIVADVFYVTGAAATAAGIYLLLTAEPEATGEPQRAAIHPWLGPDNAGLGVFVDF